jgi:hypothetical protein
MIVGVRVGTRLARWLLIAVAVFGVLVMHSLVSHEQQTPMTEGAAAGDAGASRVVLVEAGGDTQPMSGHDPGSMDVLHLCLAVLGVAGALIGLVLLQITRGAPGPPALRASASRGLSWARAPPTGLARLAELCVLRV